MLVFIFFHCIFSIVESTIAMIHQSVSIVHVLCESDKMLVVYVMVVCVYSSIKCLLAIFIKSIETFEKDKR